MRLIFIVMFLLTSTFAYAQEKIDIVTRLGPTTAAYSFLSELVSVLNKDEEIEFRINVVPGAQGETAYRRFLSINEEEKRDAILFSSQVTFTDPAHKNRIDRFNYITTLSMSVAMLMTNDHSLENVNDLVNKIRSKEVSYFAATISSNTGVMLNEIFVNNYNLGDKVKVIKYKDPQEILRSLLVKETDYTIFNPDTMQAHLKLLMSANSTRVKGYEDVKTGKESGFDDFNYSAFSLFAVPKSNEKLFKKVEKKIVTACNDERVKELIEKRKYVALCLNNETITNMLKEEQKLLIKHNIGSNE